MSYISENQELVESTFRELFPHIKPDYFSDRGDSVVVAFDSRENIEFGLRELCAFGERLGTDKINLTRDGHRNYGSGSYGGDFEIEVRF